MNNNFHQLQQSLLNEQAFFVTGTDTDIGKTIASAWLCNVLNADYFKPIQSGIQEFQPRTDSEFIQSLNLPHTYVFDEIYRFKQPLSPHLSSSYENVNIELNKIQLPKSNNKIIVEGAGGVFVPLNKDEYIIDLIKYLNIPTIVVCRSSLGTINHTCLTIKTLQSYDIKIAGIIMVGNFNAENKKAIQNYTKIDIIAELPIFNSENNWQELKDYLQN
ncbi:MAG: Dethiobiotin synthase [Pseudomonadota bacterium]|jgi:dethiobiotin synthase